MGGPSFYPIGPQPTPPASGVTSFNTRTGAVVPASGDYTAAQVGALAIASNLSDLANAAAARGNLGLGSAALLAAAAVLQSANNLSDLASPATARANLGLGSAALLAAAAVAQTANNLSDLASAATARTNLGVPATPAASVNYKPANPAGTTSATLVMMGFGVAATPVVFTPATTGKVEVIIACQAYTLTAVANMTVGGRFADQAVTAAPANGAAVTGTRFGGGAGNTTDAQIRGGSTFGISNGTTWVCQDILQVTVGHTYWFDATLLTGTIADQANLANVTISIKELVA